MAHIPMRLMWCTSYSDKFRGTCELICNWVCDCCQQPICDEHGQVDEKGQRICPNCMKASRRIALHSHNNDQQYGELIATDKESNPSDSIQDGEHKVAEVAMKHIYVGNIGPLIPEAAIRTEFEAYGRVTEVQIRGNFAVIAMPNNGSAERAVSDLNSRTTWVLRASASHAA